MIVVLLLLILLRLCRSLCLATDCLDGDDLILPLRPMTCFSSTGYPLFYLLPHDVNSPASNHVGGIGGVVVYLHGCGHSGHDFFLMPEERIIVSEALRRNLAVLSLESIDREWGCWLNDDEDFDENGDSGGALWNSETKQDVVTEWMERVGLPDHLPRLGMGVSAGASLLFIHHKTLRLNAISSYIIYPGLVDTKNVRSKDYMIPTVFVHMPRDRGTAYHVKNYVSILHSNSVPVEEYEVRPKQFDLSRCVSRLPELGADGCKVWVEYLTSKHPELLDPLTFEVKVDHESPHWLEAWNEVVDLLHDDVHDRADVLYATRDGEKEGDGGIGDNDECKLATLPNKTLRDQPWLLACVIEEIGVSFARHKMTAEYLDEVFDFMLRNIKEPISSNIIDYDEGDEL